MSDDLGLTLDTGKKEKRDRTPLLIALLIVAIAIAAIDLVLSFTGSSMRTTSDPASLERIALKLEKQELFGAAAESWIEYLRTASPGADESARVWYRIGRMRERSGDCESALAAYYRSEQTAGLQGLEQEISMGVERCLTRLSRFAALRSELKTRTSIGADDGGEAIVLAEIGSEKITRDMLEAMIEAEVDAQVAQAAAGMPADQVRSQREKILAEVMTGNDLRQWLERLVAEELLFRYAMEEKLHDDPDIAEMSRRIERKFLTSQVLAREYANSVSVTEDEVRAWYGANSAKIAASAGLDGGEIPDFKEVKDKVYAAVRLEKEMAVQAELLERLSDRYDVVIHASKLGGEPKEQQK